MGAFQRDSTNSRQGISKNTRPSLEILAREAECLFANRMATNTWKTYTTAVDSVNRFRHEYSFTNGWPVSIEELMNYIAYLSYSGLSSSTIVTYISGVSHTHKCLGLEDTTKCFHVSNLLQGVCRKHHKKSDLRVPFSFNLIHKKFSKSLHFKLRSMSVRFCFLLYHCFYFIIFHFR